VGVAPGEGVFGGVGVGVGFGGEVGAGLGAAVGVGPELITMNARRALGKAPEPQAVDVAPSGLSAASPVQVMAPTAVARPVIRNVAFSAGGLLPTSG
jgi:hypothetical protein